MRPNIHYQTDTATIWHGDSIETMRQLPDNSIDSIVTDPPYGLSALTGEQIADVMIKWATGERGYMPQAKGFMGKSWDGFVPPPALWDEAMRVLKPGGHLLAFAGTRTQDLMGLSIRLAGFEIRDSVYWHYASGFPKSLNVSRALDGKRCGCAVPLSHGNISREDVPELRLEMATEGSLSVGSGEDLLEGLRGADDQRGTEGQAGAQRPADNDSLRGMLDAGQDPAGVGEAERADVLLASVQRGGSGPAMGDAWAQGLGGAEELRRAEDGEEPGLEGRRDVQAPEGELRRPALRAVPSRVAEHGPGGRVHHGASSDHGAAAGASAAADGSREPYQSRSAGQSAREPGTVPVERGSQARGSWPVCARCGEQVIPDGLGTALKPATEPVIMGRKPLAGTVVQNVTAHGTGALNIDACRIGDGSESQGARSSHEATSAARYTESGGTNFAATPGPRGGSPSGRWPANVVLDDTTAELLDQQSGTLTSSLRGKNYSTRATNEVYGDLGQSTANPANTYGDSGGASRFFYVAKAPKRERPVVDGVAHPTVKPLALMRWLVKLVTPPGGVVLDPFEGSGTTLEACLLEGFQHVGIEREADYLPLIGARLERQAGTLPVAA